MNITTYNSDGTISKVRKCHVQVPDYIVSYDNEHSFLNITEEELEVMEAEENSLRKTIACEYVWRAILHDFHNYEEKYGAGISIREITILFEQYETDLNVRRCDKMVSSILRVHSKEILLSGVTNTIVSASWSELVVTEESNMGTNETLKSSSCSLWIRTLLCRAANSSLNNRREYKYAETVEERFYVSLQNLINKYYYALRFLELSCQNLPDELHVQKNILEAFVTKTDMYNSSKYYNSPKFRRRIVRLLYEEQGLYRRDVYCLMRHLLQSHPANGRGNVMVLGFEVRSLAHERVSIQHEITFSNQHNQPECVFTFNDEEYYSLMDSDDNNALYREIKSFLEGMYSKYESVNKERWTNSILAEAEHYFYTQKMKSGDWVAFYHFEVEKQKEESHANPNDDSPQQCFYNLLIGFIHPTEELRFTRSIIGALLGILVHNQCKSQEGLYECMFRFNFIKNRLPFKSPANMAIDNAMKYIGCIFTPDCPHVALMFRPHVRPLLESIFQDAEVQRRIIRVTPNKFSGGFNLKLVYNLIGLLHTCKIVTSGSGKMDQYISEENGETKNHVTERKSYISGYRNAKKSEILDIIGNLEKKIKDYTRQSME